MSTTQRAYVDGQWMLGSAGEYETRSPYTREIVGTAAACDAEDVDRAARAARRAQEEWARVPLLDRIDMVYRGYQLCKERNEDIAQMISREMGKTIRESREEMFQFTCEHFRRAAEDVFRYRGQVLPSTEERTNNKRILVTQRPIGVVGVISPWNFPVDIAGISLLYAVAIGNAVVWKPSEYTPRSAAMFTEIFHDAGFPPGVFNMLTGPGEAGAAVVENDNVDALVFTGTVTTGERITRTAGLKKLTLELGGNGPLIVLPDADLDQAVEAAVGGSFYLAGQCCTAAERILVHDDVHDEFVDRLLKRAHELTVGDPMDETTDMGPLCNDDVARKVHAHVDDARAKGANVIAVGEEQGLLYPPTVLTEVTEQMDIAQDETFGPVAPIMRVGNLEEALRIGNATPFALTAAVFTASLNDAWRAAEGLPHGTVYINEGTNYWDQMAPFGGAKSSGVGRELSTWMLDGLTEAKQIVFDLGASS